MIGYDEKYVFNDEKNIYTVNSSNFGFSSVLHKIVVEEELYKAKSYKKRKRQSLQDLFIPNLISEASQKASSKRSLGLRTTGLSRYTHTSSWR